MQNIVMSKNWTYKHLVDSCEAILEYLWKNRIQFSNITIDIVQIIVHNSAIVGRMTTFIVRSDKHNTEKMVKTLFNWSEDIKINGKTYFNKTIATWKILFHFSYNADLIRTINHWTA